MFARVAGVSVHRYASLFTPKITLSVIVLILDQARLCLLAVIHRVRQGATLEVTLPTSALRARIRGILIKLDAPVIFKLFNTLLGVDRRERNVCLPVGEDELGNDPFFPVLHKGRPLFYFEEV